jgi:hypothetical protein
MTRTKNAEDSVHLWFREMKSGGKSIYLDIAVKGKRKHKYEALHLTLVPEITREDKKRNEHTMKAANAMKAQRILNLTNNVPSTASSPKAKMPLIEWLKEYREARLAYGRAGMSALDSCIVYLERYNTRIRLSEVDVDFITDFVTFMRKQKNRRTGEPLSKNSINRYVSPIRAALNFAVENDYILKFRI